ncbi:hypothetical protein DBR32_07280 [Taibaiella sp. KBW10]|uniref:hypothetical protein n=1 Tax=Taibaiella sp. KBW10 TaxID=2153357 RepID=UPI000F597974|nr:hypothetical protein [Taibaiella sp. KBW10]RQO31740.1 hypothetical protein DBR32_07280 [Taibaiella sp. KBW10]
MEKEQQLSLPLEDIAGKWCIQYSNFPMWLKGDKKHPAFTYELALRKGVPGLKDTVSYLKSDKVRYIKGFDTALNKANTRFEWRGKGILFLLSSRWEIRYMAEDWALIYFEKTLFTPKGYDVISRKEHLSDTIHKGIQARLAAMGIAGLKNITIV